MNAFFEHHQDNIRLAYGCFDRLLLNGLIQPFSTDASSASSTPTARESGDTRSSPRNRRPIQELGDEPFHKWNAPILEAPEGRRDDFMDPYFRRAKPMKSWPS